MLNVEFNPIQCTSSVFKNLTAQDGFLYFVTDTKQLFLGKDNKFIDMCGGINIIYGKKEIEYVDSGQTPDPNVVFYLDDLEKKEYPLINDLILNVDGCFYKVKAIHEGSIETTRLTLQGTGGGGGSSSGGVGAANLRINHFGGQNRYFSMQSPKAELAVIAYSDDVANYVSGIELSWDETFAEPFMTISNLSHEMEKPYYVDIVKYLSKISTKGTRVYLRVTDKYGSTRYVYYTVSIASLELAALEPELFKVDADSYDYLCKIGGSLDLTSRVIRYELYSPSAVLPIFTTEYELEATQSGTISKTLSMTTVPHGEYVLRVQVIGTIGSVEILSNELTHKILRYQSSVGTALFSALIPEVTEQYTPFDLSYLLVYGDSTKTYSVEISIDNEVITTENLNAGQVSKYPLIFEAQGNYLLKMEIKELGVVFNATIEIVKYTGKLPVINVDRDDLKLYLTAQGYTNNSVNKDIWVDKKNPNLSAVLDGFYYREVNGWLKDSDEVDYLKVSQGASVSLDGYTPFDGNPKTKGLTIELDFMINGIFDYDTHFIECLSYFGDGSIKTGFVVKGDTFKYYASGSEIVSLNLVEDKRIKLAFVIEASSSGEKYPMCYTYLDGIISKVLNYSNTDDFGNNPQNPAYLRINSDGGQINIYNIRMYNTGLDAQTVLNNYQATIGSREEREKSYESNAIRNIAGDIDLEAVEAGTYNLQIPYVKIYGGYSADKSFKMSKKSSTNKPTLPIGKKDYRAIDIEMVYPTAAQNPYFSNYQNFKVTTTFSDPALNVLNGFDNTPTEGAMMYAQGTSSLEYPVKNLRVKLKNRLFTVRPDIAPVELVTFKADFMESAGAHNTGAANYIDDAYASVNMQTPGQKQFSNRKDKFGEIVTCIKGHPCVIFWNPGVDDEGNILENVAKNYHYIGKYNFNLDKATPEPFGFMNDEEDEKFGYEIDIDGNLVLDENGNKKNSIYCFEFLDNNEKVCNFESDDLSQTLTHEDGTPYTEQEKYYDTWYSTRVNEDKEVVPGWCLGFESRYPEDKTETTDADALWGLASWINDLYTIRYIDGDEERAIRRFRDEYKGYLDEEFLLAYYLITEVLLMADNRVKNMMIATWGKELRTWTTDDGVEHSKFDYIWYPIFYDMDTMLGLDNIGYVNKYYYDEDTVEDVYNGDEILWKFVRDALGNELRLAFTKFEQCDEKSFTAPKIIPYFNDNQATMANETFYNEDAFYKYIDTFRNGYINHLTGEAVLPGKSIRLYAAQGNRAMMREFFINNRIRYLRGKYESTNYQESDRIEFRLTYPKEITASGDYILTDEDKKVNASIKAVPPSGDFDFKSLKTGYAGVKVGVSSDNHRFVNEEEHTLTVNTTSGNGTETYLFGVSNLADVGDLSNKYLYMLIVGAAQNNLKRLILGNHNKDYYNPYWGTDSIELTGFRFLEEFNLENCGTFRGIIDFSDCPQIKKIYLNGSNPRGLILPVGGVIEELRVSNTLTDFAIDSHPTLQDDKFTIGYFDYDVNAYVNDYSSLAHISLKGIPNVNTYKIARATLLKPTLKLETYCFQDVNWNLNQVDDFTYDENGNISGIRVLDILLSSLNPYEGVNSVAEALTGTITVALTGKQVNEYDIYQKYHFDYPNLNIEYAEGVSVQPASEIKFYNMETIGESTEPYYTVLSNGSQTLKFLTSSNSPAGSALQMPVKVPTSTQVFSFANIWLDDNNVKYLVDERLGYDFVEAASMNDIVAINHIYQFKDAEGKLVSEYALINGVKEEVHSFTYGTPKTDLRLRPIFVPDIRYYTLSFYNDEGIFISSHVYEYKQKVWEVPDAPLYYVKDDSLLDEYIRYTCEGWIGEKDFRNANPNPTFFDLDNMEVTSDLSLYARCKEENVLTTPMDMKYFDIERGDLSLDKFIFSTEGVGYVPTDNFSSSRVDINLGPTVRINIKERYREHLGGKITMPSYTDPVARNEAITVIGDMSRMPQLKQVFFLNDGSSEYIASVPSSYGQGFYGCNNLIRVDLPASMRYIGQGCFTSCGSLTTVALNDNIEYIGNSAFYSTRSLLLDKLPEKLTYLGERAFHGAALIEVSKMPLGITQIDTNAFYGCTHMPLNRFGHTIGQELAADENNIELIRGMGFYRVGRDISNNEIYIGNSVKVLSQSCFDSFGNSGSVLKVYDASGITAAGQEHEGVAVASLVFGNRELDTGEEYIY